MAKVKEALAALAKQATEAAKNAWRTEPARVISVSTAAVVAVASLVGLVVSPETVASVVGVVLSVLFAGTGEAIRARVSPK